jgi:hypothetical protein
MKNVAIIGLFSLLLVACGGGGGSTPTSNDSPQTNVTPPVQPSTTYAISGKVTAPDGSAIQGVQLSLSGTSTNSTISNAYGDFTFTGLSGGAYTVTPAAAGMTFTPATKAVAVSTQSMSGANFQRYYASTTAIADYMSVRHGQMLSSFSASESSLSATLSAQGAYSSGSHYTQSGNSYVSQVQSFATDSLNFSNQKAQIAPIDTGAVTSFFTTYASQDESYANTYYGGVNWGLSGSSLTNFIAGINQRTNDIYTLVKLQVP